LGRKGGGGVFGGERPPQGGNVGKKEKRRRFAGAPLIQQPRKENNLKSADPKPPNKGFAAKDFKEKKETRCGTDFTKEKKGLRFSECVLTGGKTKAAGSRSEQKNNQKTWEAANQRCQRGGRGRGK